MCDILLINAPTPGEYRVLEKSQYHIPHFGLLYLAQYLLMHGYTVLLRDLFIRQMKKSEFLHLLDVERPKIVGISCYTHTYSSASEIARLVKQWNPETTVVLGGSHVTFVDEEALQTGVVDFVVRGEGEMTLLELAEHKIRKRGRPLHEIAGISYMEGTIKRTPDRPFITELDALPFPLNELITCVDYRKMGYLITSRGCHGQCIFCAAGLIAGKKYRTRSAENVVAEMRYLRYLLGFQWIIFLDDTLTAVPRRILLICKLLTESRFNGFWSCDSRIESASKELLEEMKISGCRFIQYGVESGDPGVLRAIRKGITVEQIERAVRMSRDAGLAVQCYLMVGHHADTNHTIQNTLDFSRKLQKHHNVSFRNTIMFLSE